MTTMHPDARLDRRYSESAAEATSWEEAISLLESAGTYWLSTVRPDGRPHVTPLIGVWVEDALWFTTGEEERKAKNLAGNPRCVMTTGRNAYGEGLDIVVEGDAERVSDEGLLQVVADAYVAKYGEEWRFEVRDGAFSQEGQRALVFRVRPLTAFGFHKGEPFSQTRWRFDADSRR